MLPSMNKGMLSAVSIKKVWFVFSIQDFKKMNKMLKIKKEGTGSINSKILNQYFLSYHF